MSGIFVIAGRFAEVHAPGVARHFDIERTFDANGTCVGYLLAKSFEAHAPILVVVPADMSPLLARVWSARAGTLIRADHKDSVKIVRGPQRGQIIPIGARS